MGPGHLVQLFLDTGRSTATLAEIIELGLANVTAPFNTDAIDLGAVRLERSLHTDAMRYLPNRKRRVKASIPLADHHAFIGLKSLTVAFPDPHLNNDGIARSEIRQITFQLIILNLFDNLVLAHEPFLNTL